MSADRRCVFLALTHFLQHWCRTNGSHSNGISQTTKRAITRTTDTQEIGLKHTYIYCQCSHYLLHNITTQSRYHFLPAANHCFWRARYEVMILRRRLSASVCHLGHKKLTHPKAPSAPSLTFARPRADAGIQMSKQSQSNCSRVLACALASNLGLNDATLWKMYARTIGWSST